MQKMHREDYDLICRARKQFVSLKEESLVNLQNYRLPRGCVCAQCFIIRGKYEATRRKGARMCVRFYRMYPEGYEKDTFYFAYIPRDQDSPNKNSRECGSSYEVREARHHSIRVNFNTLSLITYG